MAGEAAPARAGSAPGEKGLKRNAIGFVSSCVIGVASTAPGYSLAATLGFIAIAVGVRSPAILIVAFVPMLLIAIAYYYLNRGIFMTPGREEEWTLSVAHTAGDVDRYVAVFDELAAELTAG